MAETQLNEKNGLAIASLVLGIISILIAIFWPIAFICAVLAIIFGSIGIKKLSKNNGYRRLGIAGVILGSVGIVITAIIVIITVTLLPAATVGTRDEARKNDLASIEAQIEQYRQSNDRALPAVSNLSAAKLLNVKTIVDSGEPTTSVAVYKVNVNCRGEVVKNGYAITVILEKDGETYCRGY